MKNFVELVKNSFADRISTKFDLYCSILVSSIEKTSEVGDTDEDL